MLTVKYALALVDAALQAGRSMGLSIAVVIVDRGGRVVVSARDDQASYFSIGAAEKKAVTCVNFRLPTQELMKACQKDPILLGAVSGDASLSCLPGGIPILIDGALVAALGIAGAHYGQDQTIAEQALASAG